LAGLVVLLLLGLVPTDEEARFRRGVRAWLEGLFGPLNEPDDSPLLERLPRDVAQLVEEAGAGAAVADAELVPKSAYISARTSGVMSGGVHVTTTFRLREPAPPFTVHPRPYADDDTELLSEAPTLFGRESPFSRAFEVRYERADEEAIRTWLSPAVRRSLLSAPSLHLGVSKKLAALTFHGAADEAQIQALVEVADAIYSEKGEGGSLLEGRASPSPVARAESYRRAQPEANAPPARAEERARPSTRLLAGLIDYGLYAIAAFAVALTYGAFDWFHPRVFFFTPELHPTEPWQGGWTTKGFGVFCIAETFLVMLFLLQTYLASRRGTSVGKTFVGLRVADAAGLAPGFLRGAFLRRWVFAIPVLVAAWVVAAPPKSPKAFFVALTQPAVMAVAAIMVALVAGSIAVASFADRVAKTFVVRAPAWRPPVRSLLLESRGAVIDPSVSRRLATLVAVAVVFVVANIIFAKRHDFGHWLF
ncbi:MAG: RDD family protein, partial [Myxococcota bacterium]